MLTKIMYMGTAQAGATVCAPAGPRPAQPLVPLGGPPLPGGWVYHCGPTMGALQVSG